MSVLKPRTGRSKAVLAGVAATALAVAGLALMSTPTQAAPSAAAAASTAKKGYTGAPANPAPYTLTQPDGTTLRVHRFGDRLSNGVATVKGNYSLVHGTDGYWRYAAGRTASGQLRASSVIAGHGSAPQAAKGLAPAPSAKATQAETPPAGTGDDTELVILVQFTDVTHHASGSTEADWANHYFGATGSVDDFYDEASQGQFGLAPATETCGTTPNDGVTGWITLPYAHPNTGVDPSATEQYVADAITQTAGCVNYTAYDTSPADGVIETNELHVTIIGAGFETSYGGDECGSSIWGHEWDLDSAGVTPPTPDGITVGTSGYTTFGEWHCNAGDTPGHKATMGIMAHEFGHDVNWPDLYDTDQSGEGVGEWSLMGSGSWGENAAPGHQPGNSPSYPDAYSLYYQGWIMPTVATVTNDIAISAHQSLLLGPNPDGTDWVFNETEGDGEFFLLENRTQQGYDVSTPGCGVVIYRIDETVTPSNAANADEDDPLIAVMQADGLENLENGDNRGDTGDPWPGSTAKHDFGNATTPNTKFHDGTASNLALHVDENACAATMHVDVTHLGDASPPVTRPDNDNFADAITVTGASGNTTKNTEHATVETGEPKPAGAGRASVWYRWVAPSDGNVTIRTTGSDYDTVLGLYTGSAVNALTEVASNDDEVIGSVFTSKVTAAVTSGTTYQIAADGYGGDSGDLTLAWSLVVPTAPTVTVVHLPEPSSFGSASSIDVTVSGSNGTPTGQVTVKEGATTIGTGTLNGAGKASVTLPASTPVGAHSLTVDYAGDSNYLVGTGSVTAHVSPATSTVAAVHAPEPSTFGSASAVNVTVSGGVGTPTGSVTVKEGATTVGNGTLDASGKATVSLPATTPAGSHTLTVAYAGDGTHSAANGSVAANVNKASSTTSASAPKKVKFKQNFDVEATVAAAGGSNTGTVQVFDGSKLLGTATLAGGTATVHITKNLKSGKHTLTVKYLGSANASPSETSVKVKVKKKKKHHH